MQPARNVLSCEHGTSLGKVSVSETSPKHRLSCFMVLVNKIDMKLKMSEVISFQTHWHYRYYLFYCLNTSSDSKCFQLRKIFFLWDFAPWSYCSLFIITVWKRSSSEFCCRPHWTHSYHMVYHLIDPLMAQTVGLPFWSLFFFFFFCLQLSFLSVSSLSLLFQVCRLLRCTIIKLMSGCMLHQWTPGAAVWV